MMPATNYKHEAFKKKKTLLEKSTQTAAHTTIQIYSAQSAYYYTSSNWYFGIIA